MLVQVKSIQNSPAVVKWLGCFNVLLLKTGHAHISDLPKNVRPVCSSLLTSQALSVLLSAPVAQWIERRFPKPCVGGSSPLGGAIFIMFLFLNHASV